MNAFFCLRFGLLFMSWAARLCLIWMRDINHHDYDNSHDYSTNTFQNDRLVSGRRNFNCQTRSVDWVSGVITVCVSIKRGWDRFISRFDISYRVCAVHASMHPHHQSACWFSLMQTHIHTRDIVRFVHHALCVCVCVYESDQKSVSLINANSHSINRPTETNRFPPKPKFGCKVSSASIPFVCVCVRVHVFVFFSYISRSHTSIHSNRMMFCVSFSRVIWAASKWLLYLIFSYCFSMWAELSNAAFACRGVWI